MSQDSSFPGAIVSLTTISGRTSSLEHSLESILDQTLPAAEIHLWISSEPYMLDEGITKETLPRYLATLRDSGKLQIHWTQNTGPYRKLLPLLQERWNDKDLRIVTADDDVRYPRDWLKGLCERSEALPDCVIAYRTREITFQGCEFAPYLDWRRPGRVSPLVSPYLVPIGCDGVLYKPRFFSDRVFESDFRELCPTNDDVWFKSQALLQGTQVACVNRTHQFFWEDKVKQPRLFDTNRSGVNDRYFAKTFQHFRIDKAFLDRRASFGVRIAHRAQGMIRRIHSLLRDRS